MCAVDVAPVDGQDRGIFWKLQEFRSEKFRHNNLLTSTEVPTDK